MNFRSREQLRIDVITKYLDGQIHAEHAWTLLEVGERQFRRIVRAFQQEGIWSVKHGNFGKTPKNKISTSLESKIVALYKKDYRGFNTLHFRDKLIENNFANTPSYSTIRRILVKNGINLPKKRSGSSSRHKSRDRYAKEGIMAQIDGSHHQWFGNKMSCLNAMVDDATGRLLSAKFTPSETTFAAMDILEQTLKKYGIFQMLYSDGAGVYHGHKREGFSNVQRALRPLGILSLVAPTAEAKGRIERLFRTLQDRLINEMRLRKISTIEEANKFLPSFIEYFNSKFAVIPKDPETAFLPLPDGIDLNELMCIREERIIQRGHTFSYKNQKCLLPKEFNFPIIGKVVEIRTYRDGSIKYFLNDEEIEVEILTKYQKVA